MKCGRCGRFRAARGAFPPRCTDCRRLERGDEAAARKNRVWYAKQVGR